MTKEDLTLSTAGLELVTMSFKCYRVHRDLIARAAALEPNRTESDYIRSIMPMQAALDLNEELPRVPDITRGRAGSLVAQAAARLGMPREEFEAHAARLFAAQTLGADAIDNRPSSVPPARAPSERPARPARPSGMYSSSPHEAVKRRAR